MFFTAVCDVAGISAFFEAFYFITPVGPVAPSCYSLRTVVMSMRIICWILVFGMRSSSVNWIGFSCMCSREL